MFYLELLKWLFCCLFSLLCSNGSMPGLGTCRALATTVISNLYNFMNSCISPTLGLWFSTALFNSVCLWCIWEINVPPMTHYLHHNYNFLMTICVLFMQLRLTSLDKILADLIFRSTGLAHSPETFSKASIQCFYTINLVFQFSLSTLSWWRHLLKRSNIQEEQGSFPP